MMYFRNKFELMLIIICREKKAEKKKILQLQLQCILKLNHELSNDNANALENARLMNDKNTGEWRMANTRRRNKHLF